MYALVEILGKQYKAIKGATLRVDKIDSEVGEKLEFDKVLAVSNDDKVVFGTPYVKGAKIVATLGEAIKDKKIKIFKFKRRKGYRRTQGHRQNYSMITIDDIKA
ncbi:MAG: 50S ribosomal protein L21 [Sphaerochaetaceae bacterium]